MQGLTQQSTKHGLIAALLGCLAIGGVETVRAVEPRPTTPCRCSADGVCRPNRLEWGYWHTNWRRWPGDAIPEAAGATDEGEQALEEELKKGFIRPKPADEDLRGPAKPERGESAEDTEGTDAGEADPRPLEGLPQSRVPSLQLPIANGVSASPTRIASRPQPYLLKGGAAQDTPVRVDPFDETQMPQDLGQPTGPKALNAAGGNSRCPAAAADQHDAAGHRWPGQSRRPSPSGPRARPAC